MLNPSIRHIWGADFKGDCYLRRSFSLAGKPSRAVLRLFADTGYELFLNGRFVAALDEWSNTRTYDVRVFLQPGVNLIAVHGVNHGGHRGCAAELDCDGTRILVTDADWRGCETERWGWLLPEFDDSSWPSAALLPLDCAGNSCWITPPDGETVIPNLTNCPFFAREVPRGIDSPFYRQAKPADCGAEYPEAFPVPRVIAADGAEAHGRERYLISAPDRWQGPGLSFDFGGEVVGYFRLRLESAGRMRFRIFYGETVDEIAHPPEPEQLLARMLIEECSLPPGRQEFESRIRSGCRFVRVEFFHCPEAVSVSGWHLRSSLYPVRYRGIFRSSDPELNRMWQMSRKTLHLCMQEYYLDAPKRDRFLWVADARLEALFNYYAFGDLDLFRFCWREIAGAQYPDGAIPSAMERGNSILWDYVAHWIIAFRDYYRQTGDRAFPLELKRNILAAVEWLEARADSDGLIDVPPNPYPLWMVVLNGHTGKTPDFNRLFLESLETAELVCRLDNDDTGAEHYRKLAARTAGALHRLPDPLPGTFDTWIDAFLWTDRLYEEGRNEEAEALLRRYWGGQGASGMDTLPEGPKLSRRVPVDVPDPASEGFGSWCHGWAAAPLALLPTRIAGIRPLAPGYARFRVEPAPGTLTWMETTVPTPHGDIEFSWRRNGKVKLRVPEGTSAELIMEDNSCEQLASGIHERDGALVGGY